MNAVYVSLVTASLFFLVGWVVMLLVACALAFRGQVRIRLLPARAPGRKN